MLVSNFVLMFSDRAVSLLDIRYSLQITNLEEQTIDFIVECHVTAPEGEASPVNYLSNFLRASINSAPKAPFSSFRQGNVVVVRHLVGVGARMSALFDLRTVDTFGRLLKGFIALRVPPIRSDERGFYPIPQIGHPVRVLLHARREETRWSELYARDPDDRYVMRFPTGLHTSSEAMAISTGRAENEITPEGLLMFETDVIKFFRNP
jgi:hypothetical protein